MLSRYKLQKMVNIVIEDNGIFQNFKDTISKKRNWLKLYQSKSLFVDNNNSNNNNNNINNDNNSGACDANDDLSL